jgi:radical SAM protein with 4Fe4S-binding SPASM domain
MILSPQLRYRTDGICYHPRIGYFAVPDLWIDLFDARNRQSGDFSAAASPAKSADIRKRLLELGLVSDDVEPTAIQYKRPLPDFGEETTAPLDAEIYPTYRCNHNCRFCSSGDRVSRSDDYQDLPPEWIDEIAERLDKVGLFNVGIVGGEPFLYRHLDRLIDALISRGMQVQLTTNASVSPYKIAAVYRSGLHLAISIHGANAEENDLLTGQPGSFSRAVRAISYLIREGIPVRIISVIETPSVERIRRLAKYWYDLGLTEMTFNRAIPIGKARQYQYKMWDAESILRLEGFANETNGDCHIKIHAGLPFQLSVSPQDQGTPFYLKADKRCDAGIRGIYIDPSADLYPCELLAKEKFKLGNLLSDNWPELLINSPVLSYLRSLSTPNTCLVCSYADICRGGCPGLQDDDETRISLPMPLCPFTNLS